MRYATPERVLAALPNSLLLMLVLLIPSISQAADVGVKALRSEPREPLRHEVIAPEHQVDLADPDGHMESEPFGRYLEAQRTTPIPRAASFPLFDWPLDRALHDGIVLAQYVDDDTTGAVKDYEGLPHSYNGSRGTDLNLYSFREMDRGYPVLAAATGFVTAAVFDKVDRNYNSFPDEGNVIYLRHNAGNERSRYFHLRKNSLTVAVGDSVQPGDTIAFVGSSGFSTDAGLHFEVGTFTPSWVPRDPWNGSYQTQPSLWTSQEAYVGDDPIRIYELDVTTQTAAGGDVFNIPLLKWKERMSAPAVMGAGEPYLTAWMLLQGQASDTYTIRVRRPDNSVFASGSTSLGVKTQYYWHKWVWSWATIPSSDYGTWTVEVEHNSSIIKQTSFVVGASTAFGPRFYPLAGRSFRVTGSEQRDTLRIESLGGPVTYALINAPSFVSLVNDSIVVIGSHSTMTRRSDFFRAVATDGAGRKDTMWYHLVDFSRPWKCYPDADGDGWGDATSPGYSSVTDTDGVCLSGTVSIAFDCDDSDPAINPLASEVCNGFDDNCNNAVDEDVQTTYYRDADGDGFGTPSQTTLACSPPGGYVANSSDCNDGNSAIKPGASETCNGVDDNCNGQIDEGVSVSYYRDFDGDGFGNPAQLQNACSQPSGYVTDNHDCNDSSAAIHPGVAEVCDGKDNNCSGQVDEGVTTTYYQDSDHDGYGHEFFNIEACSPPPGYVTLAGDCNINDSTIHPGATEVCDGIDNNCNGQIDEGLTTTWYLDVDGDGYGHDTTATQFCTQPSSDWVSQGGDCRPLDWQVHPGATENCSNGKDDDCDGGVDNCGSCLVTLTGDVNVSGNITSADIIVEVNYVFKSGAPPQPCVAAGDTNCSGTITSADIIGLVNYTFKGGAAPCNVCTIVPGQWACP